MKPDESFTVTITSASNATLETAIATGTILNDAVVVVVVPVTPVPVNSPWVLRAAMLGVVALRRKFSQPEIMGRH